MQEETVSVIIPVFNSEKYLARTIESVLAQTYKNLQIVLVDDGSTDRSLSICKQYSSIDNRIQIIHQDNNGVSVARNKGLDVAEGTYILFIDSDDYLEYNACEILCNSISPEDCMCVCGYYIEKSDGGGTEVRKFPAEPISGVFSTETTIRKLLTGKEIKSYAWNKLIRKSIIDDVRFNPEIKYQEDLEFFLRLCNKVDGLVRVIDSYLYHYIDRNNGLTHNQENRLNGLEMIANGILNALPETQELVFRYSILYMNECTALALLNKVDSTIIRRNCRYIREHLSRISHLLNKGQFKKMVLLCIGFRIYALAERSNYRRKINS